MRTLLVVGGIIALGILLVAASHPEQAGIETEDETVQEDLVKEREIRSTGGNRRENNGEGRQCRKHNMLSALGGARLEKGDSVKEGAVRCRGGNRRENNGEVRPSRKPGMLTTLSGLTPRQLEKADIKIDREIRSTGGSRKKSRPLRKSPGVYSPLGRPSKTKRSAPQQEKPKKCIGCFSSLEVDGKKVLPPRRRQQRSAPQQGKRKKCTGCFSSLEVDGRKEVLPPRRRQQRSAPQQGNRKKCTGCFTSLVVKGKTEVRRQQRDTEEHEKLKKKRKHRKDKKKSKRRHKHHKDRDAHLETEDPEPEENHKRPKHLGKRKKWLHRPGDRSAITSVLPTAKTSMGNHYMEDMTG